MGVNGRIALGMSGGVDSAAAALLLVRAGYEVVGITCLFLDDETSRAAARDAARVCEQLGIVHVVKDCRAVFETEVTAPFVRDYLRGVTPSPCVGCNARCKIPCLMQVADERSCAQIATGHYARIAQLSASGRFVVKAALDVEKDQSYMLSQLTQDQLARLVLPLGAATKAEVRLMADDEGLVVAKKPESQDICFIQGDYNDFLSRRGVFERPGSIVTRAGEVLGCHRGLFRYTIGQRKGIGIAADKPYYVIAKHLAKNELVVGFQEDTFITEAVVAGLTWQVFEQLEEARECKVKLRYRSRSVACVVEPCVGRASDGGWSASASGIGLDAGAGASGVEKLATDSSACVHVRLRSPQPSTAPGQFAVFYEGETVLGGGVIQAVS